MPAAETQIRINTLLLEREALFLRVHELESAASAILGEPFPFELPPLPSTTRRKGKAKARKPAATPQFKLRKLTDDEVAYRVTYCDRGETKIEEHETPNPLTTLLAARSEHLQVHTVETLDTAGASVAQLWVTPDQSKTHP